MRELILTLSGYKKVDFLQGMWKVSTRRLDGGDSSLVEYSNYSVYYNRKKDLYKMIIGGYRPYQHMLNSELSSIIDFLNNKPQHSDDFHYDIQDYFDNKESLMTFISSMMMGVSSTNQQGMAIVKFELDVDRAYVMKMRSSSQDLVSGIQAFRKMGMSKGEEVFEEIDNILVTSNGYYVCTHKENLNYNNGISETDEGDDSDIS